jgi:hypothetical protein
MYTYGYNVMQMKLERVVCTRGQANGWRSSRYGSLPIYLLPKRHPCYYSTACYTVYIYGHSSSAYAYP